MGALPYWHGAAEACWCRQPLLAEQHRDVDEHPRVTLADGAAWCDSRICSDAFRLPSRRSTWLKMLSCWLPCPAVNQCKTQNRYKTPGWSRWKWYCGSWWVWAWLCFFWGVDVVLQWRSDLFCVVFCGLKLLQLCEVVWSLAREGSPPGWWQTKGKGCFYNMGNKLLNPERLLWLFWVFGHVKQS